MAKKDEAPTGDDAGQAQVQQEMDEATDQGFIGEKVDPTPDGAYTIQGVTGDEPTPETDPALRREAEEAAGVVEPAEPKA